MAESSEVPITAETESSQTVDWYKDSDYKFSIGTYQEVIESEDQFDNLEGILNEPFDKDSTRNVAIAVISSKLLKEPSVSVKKFMEENLETLIPLSNTGLPELEDCYMVWLGRNQEGRSSDQKTIDEEIKQAKEIFMTDRPPIANRIDSLLDAHVEVLTQDTPEEVKIQVRELLKKLEWEDEGTDEVLNTPEDILAIATKDENGQKTVIGVGMAIFDGIEVKRGDRKIPLNIYEFTGAVTREGFEGKGVYQAISQNILSELSKRDPRIHVGIGYSNASEIGVIKAAFKMSRELSILETEKLGYKGKPLLQHSTVSGKFVDDIITFIPGNSIRQNFGMVST